jgi:periplasmic divalent cation tolerance protein
MRTSSKAIIVLVTAPDMKTARQLAKAALEARLVACVNVIPRLESHYWWRGKLERASELLLILKTTRPRLRALEKLVVANHPYDTPEFVTIPAGRANQRYLEWWLNSVP